MRALLAFFLISALVALSQQQTCSVTHGYDIALADLAEHNFKQEWECCGLCSQNPSCRGYAWNAYMGGTCWLKAGTDPMIPVDGVSSGRLEGGGGGELVTWDEFNGAVTALGYPGPSRAQYDSFIQGIPRGSIATKQEAAMALTHFVWESDGLRAKREYACEFTGCPGSYETPGCDAPGQRYFGRGYIQLSWCYNYQPASQALFGDDTLVRDPDHVARDENTAWNTAFWFWQVNVHWRDGVAQGRFGVTTRAINGGLECDGAHQDTARHRFQMYRTVRRVFGLPGDGDETGCYN